MRRTTAECARQQPARRRTHFPSAGALDAGERRYRQGYRGRQTLLAQGRHNTFKLKIGAGELNSDIRHALAIKSALGEEVSIRWM
ncbi:hypothetical protein [Lelliottia nimipressuralis]|uniref:hypothetical protein n=1 Tax=Lelliottia nimipressuralis TaxID=69220 RepID=UPI003D26F1E1